MGQNNHAISWDKKSNNLLRQKHHITFRPKKIMQPLETKKSCNLFRQKKNHAKSQDKKKVTQPLETKYNALLGTKNHATYWDKRNHATSWDQKKLRKLLGGKSRNLWGGKLCNLSGQTIMLKICPIASNLANKAPNCSKWHKICPNGSK